MSTVTLEPPRRPSGGAAPVIAKIVRRLIPLLCVLYVINYLDRTNIAMAKLRMLSDLGLDERIYGLGTGVFFIGYFLFELPSNLILERVGARMWITRIVVTWGAISTAMAFVRGPWSFYVLRFLLGIAEAGFFPGIVLYLTYWVPARCRASVLAAFLTSIAISGIVGNPLAGLLMTMEGVGGMHGWQWLFLIEGVMPMLLGVVTIMLLPDKPANAKWLSDDERAVLQQELALDHSDAGDHISELRHAIADARLWLLATIYFMLIMGLYGFMYWLPTLVQQVSQASPLRTGMLSAIPYVVAAGSMVMIARHSDRHNERRWHVALTALTAALGIAAVTYWTTTLGTILSMCVAGIGIWGYLGPFWSLVTRLLRGTAAAGGIAIVNSFGNLAGFVSPSIIGWAKTRYGSYAGGLLLVSAALVCGAILVLCVNRKVDRASSVV